MKLERANLNHACGTQDDFVLNVWRRETLVVDVEYMGSLIVRHRMSNPRLHLLQVVERTAVIPTPEARAALAKMLRTGTGAIVNSCVVFEGDGFQASMVRGITTGLAMLARNPFPHVVVATVSEALAMHARHDGVTVADARLRRVAQALAQLRSAIDRAQTADVERRSRAANGRT